MCESRRGPIRGETPLPQLLIQTDRSDQVRMHPKKMASVMRMNGADRFSYFVRKVADFELLWGLFDDGWAIAADADDAQVLPLWPEKEFAAACAENEWSSFRPVEISLGDLLDSWVDGLTKDGLGVAVFPTIENKGVVVTPIDLRNALQVEIAHYE